MDAEAEATTALERPTMKIPSAVLWAIWMLDNPLELSEAQRTEWRDEGTTALSPEQMKVLDQLVKSWWLWGEHRVERRWHGSTDD